MADTLLAPGVEIRELDGRFQLWIKHNDESIIGWDFEEIAKSPKSWISSLKTTILAITQGPSAVKRHVDQRKSQVKLSPDMLCMVCGRSIRAATTEYYFSATLNNKHFRDYQCSAECNKKRKEQVLRQELGTDFIDKWSGKLPKSKLEHLT